jgi:large subunit ribosomal protein L25
MDEIVLQATNRKVIRKQIKALRRSGILPAIIYGHNIDPIPISMDQREIARTLSKVTSSSLVIVDVEGEKITTLVRDRQYDPVSGSLLHVDFLSISMTEILRMQ